MDAIELLRRRGRRLLQDWVLNYNLERQLQLASRVGESSRHIRLNWSEGPRFWTGRNWSGLRDFASRYGFVLFGGLALALLGKFLGRDGWRWWSTRQRLLKVQRGKVRRPTPRCSIDAC